MFTGDTQATGRWGWCSASALSRSSLGSLCHGQGPLHQASKLVVGGGGGSTVCEKSAGKGEGTCGWTRDKGWQLGKRQGAYS